MESVARQSASFACSYDAATGKAGRCGGAGGQSEPPGGLAGGDGGARQVEALQRQLHSLQLRLAAEQQCVTREQHITARMWLEKSQAEEAAAESAAKAAEHQATTAQWDAWHASQRRQQRQRRAILLHGRSSEGAASWRAGSGASPAERLVASICVDVLGLTSASSLPDEARSRLANLLGEAAELVRDPPSAEADPLCTRPPGLSCG
ncbi:hypothetical protein EMIHUDRAFT_245291 [Emiliania huxleyi CCMP1516]|nr:hypothetical protein EMIHUDRAFT_245291 [Emiliania huxleyi CCMP1516]EOD16128.1 hypothetical protein EMIHUDRAFT_245291 [Emiliania huxleyi CCMP1516]|eukprot:XP_005768557.1 hypothetical protein EMIHUDRAFT_245291 [Emiliania huxleyi CCMP1516]